MKDITKESSWDCGICFNSAPIWSAADQPSYHVSKFSESLHLLLSSLTAAENGSSDEKNQPSGKIRCLPFLLFYSEKNPTNNTTGTRYNGLMDYTAHLESYAYIWVRVDLFRNFHVGIYRQKPF